MTPIRALAGIIRLPFLLLTPACVSVGVGSSLWTCPDCVSVFRIALVLLGALCAHVSVNAFNEYYDFRSGLDAVTRRTPFSGGSGVLPANPEFAPMAWRTALITFGITMLVGLYLLTVVGIGLLPIGLAGLAVIYFYTQWMSRRPLICLLAPGLGFGVLMVVGTHYAITGAYSWTALSASMVPSFLVSNLLLLNQFPDVEADSTVGRRNLPIVIGKRASVQVYGLFAGLAYLSVVIGVVAGVLPGTTLLSLGTIFLAMPIYLYSRRYTDDVERLKPWLALNVMNSIGTPVLLAIGLAAG
ncbi:MAG: prenyltransferase [Pseudomonadota bacterium]